MNIDLSIFMRTVNKLYTQKQVRIPTGGLMSTIHASVTPVAPVVTNTCSAVLLKSPKCQLRRGREKKKKKKKPYTVLLSCLISLEENSLRMSKKAKLRGGPPSPWGLGSLNANSIPSLRNSEEQRDNNTP